MKPVDVVLANNDRVTVRVGDMFLKIDSDRDRAEHEIAAIGMAPVPTPDILWHRPPVLALAPLPGRTLGRLGQPATASAAAWTSVGRALRRLHDAPLPPWPATQIDDLAAKLRRESDWLVAEQIVTAEQLAEHRRIAERVLRPWRPAFIHGDLHLEHVFVDGDDLAGIIDWSEARCGDAHFDLASLTLGNADRLDDVIHGYGGDVDRELVSGWWSFRCIGVVRWLFENGYGSPDEFPEVALLRADPR